MSYKKGERLLIVEPRSYSSCCEVYDIVIFKNYDSKGDVLIATTNRPNIVYQTVRPSAVISCENLTPLLKAIYGLE